MAPFTIDMKYNSTVRTFRASVWQEGELYVAQCLDVDVASQGMSEEESLASLRDALHLQFSSPVATALPKISTVEVNLEITVPINT